MNDKEIKIVIAGASGFVGKKLIHYILDNTNFRVVALSRSEKKSLDPRLEWRKVDLFSLLEVEKATAGCDIAIYLVHSMLPSAHLDQGTFEDYDLLLADNFATAIEKNKLKQVVYLGGIIPDEAKLSLHLRSRLEIEKVFENKSFKFTNLRAGLIIGRDGSSFNIMYNLVNRLPILVCPKWTESLATPIYIDDVIESLAAVLNNEKFYNTTYEIGGATTLTYRQLLEVLANKLKLNRLFFAFPLSIIFISRLWVRLFSGASKELVYPLLESLKHSMATHPNKLLPIDKKYLTYEESIDNVVKLGNQEVVKYSPPTYKKRFVRSVQRFDLPKNKSAIWVAEEYMRWLPQFLSPFLKVVVDNGVVKFNLLFNFINLLELTYSVDRSYQGRTLFYITGGLLAKVHEKGRLEFRETLDKNFIIAAIHDFKPALPWFIYKYTQAIVHLFVMLSFGRHLSKLEERENI